MSSVISSFLHGTVRLNKFVVCLFIFELVIFNEKQLTITFLSKSKYFVKKILTTLKVNDMLTFVNSQKMRKNKIIKGNNFDKNQIVFLGVLSILSRLFAAMLILHKG